MDDSVMWPARGHPPRPLERSMDVKQQPRINVLPTEAPELAPEQAGDAKDSGVAIMDATERPRHVHGGTLSHRICRNTGPA